MPKGIKKAKDVIPEVPKVIKESFDVFDEKGMFIRTYSVEVHGEEAGELAEGYALKINGSVK